MTFFGPQVYYTSMFCVSFKCHKAMAQVGAKYFFKLPKTMFSSHKSGTKFFELYSNLFSAMLLRTYFRLDEKSYFLVLDQKP